MLHVTTHLKAALPENSMNTEIHHFINGTLATGHSGRSGSVYNPATGDISANVPLASAAEVDEAISIAKSAFNSWAATPAPKRARVLIDFLKICSHRAQDLAAAITAEHGKTLADARGEIQ